MSDAITSNVTAQAWVTTQWLAEHASIAIPVYQREYRWDLADCAQLLEDVRRIAGAEPGSTHFVGSILAVGDDLDDRNVTLVDGQQRVTTLMLLLAAIRDLAREAGSDVSEAIDLLLLRGDGEARPKLVPHERFQEVVVAILVGAEMADASSAFRMNYEFFKEAASGDWAEVWSGVQRLEHVSIQLGAGADAQQIFESLNSTGAALSDDELIHNYVHMGRAHQEQLDFERDTWLPIEQLTAGATREFWRDYLVLASDAQPELVGDFAIYKAFRRRYADPRADITPELCADWLRHARWYGAILSPTSVDDQEVRHALELVQAFAGAPRPLLLWLYGQYDEQHLSKGALLHAVQQLQTLFVRRALVNLSGDAAIIGTICREVRGGEAPSEALIRRTPEDPAVRRALIHSALPHAAYVLRRIQAPGKSVAEMQVEHIHPQNPREEWTGGDGRTWGTLTPEEQAEYRAVLNTIGNLTLLEAAYNQGAGNRSFVDKFPYYVLSAVDETKSLTQRDFWDRSSIEQRTRALIDRFLEIWPRQSDQPLDELDELMRVVDLELTAVRGYPDVYEHCVFEDQLWGDVHDAKQLLVRLADELWRRDPQLLAASEYGWMVRDTREPRKQYVRMPSGMFLYTGWANQYLLGVAQSYVTLFGLEDAVRVKLAE